MEGLQFRDYLGIGREKWLIQANPWRALFNRLFGPLDIHYRVRNGHVLQLIQSQKWGERLRVLEAGSGSGLTCVWLARRFPLWQISGVELKESEVLNSCLIAQAMGVGNVSFFRKDLEELDSHEQYDLAFAVDVLEHIWDDKRALANLWRALKKRGSLIVHVPLQHQLQRRFLPPFKRHRVSEHVRDEYTEAQLLDKVRGNGFEVRHLSYTFGPWGEMAFELNNLFWEHRCWRNLAALLSFPVCLALGYLDVRQCQRTGNSLFISAQKPG